MKKELLNALLAVQKELPVVGKTTDAYKYKYAPIDQVWDKIGKVLSKNGFVVTNKVTPGGVKTSAWHEHGELHSYIAFSNLDLKPQDRGSEITYARRYNLTAIFNVIVAGEDDDASGVNDAPRKPLAPVRSPNTPQTTNVSSGQSKASEKQVKAVYAIATKKGIDIEAVKSKLGIESLNDMSVTQASKFIEQMGDKVQESNSTVNF